MRFKVDEEGGQKGDQKVYVICMCKNPEQKDLKRIAIAKVVIKRVKPVIPTYDLKKLAC